MALTQWQLERGGCATPNCGHDHSVLYLNAKCHPGTGVEVAYIKGQGIARVTCLKCQKIIADLAIHAGGPRATVHPLMRH